MSITDFKIQTQNVTRTLTRVFPEAWRAGPSLEGSTCVSPNNCFGALRDCWGGGSRVSASPEAKPWDLGVSRPTWTDAADSTLWADGEDQGQRTCTTEQIGLRERAGVRPALRAARAGLLPPVRPSARPALRLFGCRLCLDSTQTQKRTPVCCQEVTFLNSVSLMTTYRFPERAPKLFKRRRLPRAPEEHGRRRLAVCLSVWEGCFRFRVCA